MYGLIGKIICQPGYREQFSSLLLKAVPNMPGCLSYIIANDQADENTLWITEVWATQELHRASLSLPSIQAAIAEGRPMIASFADRVETTPIGGNGL